MPRARNIKPAFFMNPELAECSLAARLLFIGLWTLCDREGRMEYRPKFIKMNIFPSDDIEVVSILSELETQGLISTYYHPTKCDKKLIFVINFTKHQNPHKNEPSSILPPHHEYVAENNELYPNRESSSNDSSTPADSLILIPDSRNPLTPSGGDGFEKVVELFSSLPHLVANVEMSKKAWTSKNLDLHAEQILSAIHTFSKTVKWQNGYGPKLSAFLLGGEWKNPPKLPYGVKSGIK